MLVSQTSHLSNEISLLLFESGIVTGQNVCELLPVSLFLSCKFILVPTVETLELLFLFVELIAIGSFVLLTLVQVLLLTLISLLSKLGILVVSLRDLLVMACFHLVHFIEVDCLGMCSLFLLLLNLFHQLIHLSLEALLELFFHLCVFLELCSGGRDCDLELLSGTFTFSHKALVLFNVAL